MSPVMDRTYFHSIYYCEPGGVLFEIATDNPGFAVDETLDKLGTKLMLPTQYEPLRAEIDQIIPKVRARRTYSPGSTLEDSNATGYFPLARASPGS